MFAEALLMHQTWKEMPRLIMAIFMENHDAGFAHHVAQLVDQQRRITHKRHDPPAPGKIVISLRQCIRHYIQLVDLHVRERAFATALFHCADEVFGTFKRDDLAGRSDDFSKIASCVPRSRADVEDALANRDTGSLPAI